MNLWERAKATLRYVAEESGERTIRDKVWDLLAEMERVECVEGGAVKDRGFSELWDFHCDSRGTDRPALLLLLPEEENR